MTDTPDIVARLRDMAIDGSHDQLRYEKNKRLAAEAANEIDRLLLLEVEHQRNEVDRLREAVRVLAHGAGDLSALVSCENWCEAREYGRKCTCGKERDHDAIIDVIKANPIAANAINAAEGASKR